MLTEDKELAENFEFADGWARDGLNRNGVVGTTLLLFWRDDFKALENFCVWSNAYERAARFGEARELLARHADITHYAIVEEVWVCEAPKDGAPDVHPLEAPDGIGFVQIVAAARSGGQLARFYRIVRKGDKARLKRWRDFDGKLQDNPLARLFEPVTPTTRH